jgi:hypothetical protein
VAAAAALNGEAGLGLQRLHAAAVVAAAAAVRLMTQSCRGCSFLQIQSLWCNFVPRAANTALHDRCMVTGQ